MSYADLSLPDLWYFCVCTHICLAFGNEFIVTELLFTMRLFLSIACLPPSERACFQRALQTEKSLFLFLKFFRELPGSLSEAQLFQPPSRSLMTSAEELRSSADFLQSLNILKVLLFFSYYGWVVKFSCSQDYTSIYIHTRQFFEMGSQNVGSDEGAHLKRQRGEIL